MSWVPYNNKTSCQYDIQCTFKQDLKCSIKMSFQTVSSPEQNIAAYCENIKHLDKTNCIIWQNTNYNWPLNFVYNDLCNNLLTASFWTTYNLQNINVENKSSAYLQIIIGAFQDIVLNSINHKALCIYIYSRYMCFQNDL